MSKIGSGSGETLNQLKDHYALRERETQNRHREEIASLKDTHREEIGKVREEGEARLQKVHEDNAARMTEKDIQFRKEVEAIRSMYAKRLAEAKRDSDT